jgi:hypothetical protein
VLISVVIAITSYILANDHCSPILVLVFSILEFTFGMFYFIMGQLLSAKVNKTVFGKKEYYSNEDNTGYSIDGLFSIDKKHLIKKIIQLRILVFSYTAVMLMC